VTSLFSQATPTGTITAGTGNNGTNGLHFTVSAAAPLEGTWHWSSSSDTQLPTSIGLYSTQASPSTGTVVVAAQAATWLTGPGGTAAAAGSGWCYAAFTSPPTLASGTNYMAVAFRNDAANRWFSFYSVTWPVTSGIITAPKDESTSALSQGWYNIGTALAFPATQSGTAGSNFGMDVEVGSGTSVSLPVAQVTAAAPLPALAAGPVAIPVAQVAAAANTVTGGGITAGVIRSEAGGGLLTEDGGSLATEVPAGALTLPVAQVSVAGLALVPVVSVPLPAAAVAVSAPLPSLAAGPVALPAAQVDAAAPLPVPAVSVPLPVAQVNAAGFALTPDTSVFVALPVAQVAVSAPVPSLAAGPVALPAGAVEVAAPLPAPVASVPLPVAQEAVAAYSPASAAGPVSLPAAAVTVAAPLPAPAAKVPLPAAQVNVAAPLPLPSVSVPLPAAQVTAAGHPLAPSAPVFVALPVAQVTAAALPVTPFVPPVFPYAPLDLRCELLLGTTYTDVSGYAYQRAGTSPPISITRGRPDESSTANPAACTWEWNNRDGRFSPLNPLSPYFGMLGRNTPVRWSVPAASTYLRLEAGVGAYAYAPEASRLDITGSLEVRIALRMSDWRACDLAGKFDGTSASSWIWNTDADGTMQFWWWDGSALHFVQSTAPLPAGTRAVRVTLDVTTGTVTHYTSTGIDGTWTQLGTAASGTGGASTSVHSGSGSSVPLTVGWSANNPTWQLYGRVTGFRLYNGIGGTVVADAAFSAQAAGAATWTDSPGNTWTVTGGAELSGRDYRFNGEMSAQPPKWDVTGTDQAVTAAAGGPLRRLSQGTANAMSAMKRAILLQGGSLAPQAYWSLEDAAGASVFGASLGGLPMTFDQNPAPDLATDSSFIASAPLPTFNGSRFYGRVAPYSGGSSVIVRWLCKLGTVTLLPGLTYAPLARISTSGTVRALYVVAFAGSGTLGLIGYDSSGTDVINTGPLSFGADGTPLYYSVEIQLVSGNVQASLVTLAPGASSGLAETVTLAGGNVGNCSVVALNPNALFTDTVAGHVTLQATDSSLFALGQPLNAWTGEMAADRYARLAGENGYQARIIGSPAYSAQMGPQGIDTLSDLLTEVEAADLGQQFEPRQVLALGYRTLASMCAQPPRLTMDYAQSQPGGVNGGGSDSGLDPTYDDQLLANDWTVTRGSSTGSQGATVQVQLDDGSAMSISNPPTGVGDYAKTQTVNTEYDAQLQDVAGWMVHTGTVDQARWPGIPVNLARPAIQDGGLYYPVLDADVGDYLELASLPDVVLYDPVKQLLFGSKESLGGFHHTVEFNAVPEVPYEVIVLDDPVYGRVDTDGSTLHTTAAYPQSSLSVSTGAGFPLWTTAAADFPFDVNVSGMRLTVTSITGSSSPQIFTVTPAVNGVEKSLAAGSDVRLWFPPILSLT
jgi:hypothetical protein